MSGRGLSFDEIEIVRNFIEDEATFATWQKICGGLLELHTKIYVLHENLFKVVNFMQAMSAFWNTYEHQATIFTNMLAKAATIEGEGAEEAYKLMKSYVVFDFNNGIEHFEHKPLVEYSLNYVEQGGKKVATVEMDHTNVKKALELGAGLVEASLGKVKGFDLFLSDLESSAKEHGEEIPDILTKKLYYLIESCKEELSNNISFSYTRYKELLSEGYDEAAREMKERFVFPNWETTEANLDVFTFHRNIFNVWN